AVVCTHLQLLPVLLCHPPTTTNISTLSLHDALPIFHSSKHIELAEKASIKGNVYYNLIEMAMGAAVNGNLVHSDKAVSEAAPAKAGKPELVSAKPLEKESDDEKAESLKVAGKGSA